MLSLKLVPKEDAWQVTELLARLWMHSPYANISTFSYAEVENKVANVIHEGLNTGCVLGLYAGDRLYGILIASYVKQLFDPSHKMAVELAYWIEPHLRNFSNQKKLLGAYRFWAKKVGCHSILMGKLKNKNEVETYTIRKL